MILLDWRLSIASFLLIPVLLMMTQLLQPQRGEPSAKPVNRLVTYRWTSKKKSRASKSLSGFTRTDVNRERFAQRNAANRDANVSATAITAAFEPLVDVLAALGIAIVAGYGGYLVLQNQSHAWVVVVFCRMQPFFSAPSKHCHSFIQQRNRPLAAAERTFSRHRSPH
jgi:ATP-binding cassette subfamily B protein/subfamily B ATP-binding cassette protein MsbA